MEGAGKGGDEGGAIRDGASMDITRGTHLMAVYPALFSPFPQRGASSGIRMNSRRF